MSTFALFQGTLYQMLDIKTEFLSYYISQTYRSFLFSMSTNVNNI